MVRVLPSWSAGAGVGDEAAEAAGAAAGAFDDDGCD
jgi:hypothetical protein